MDHRTYVAPRLYQQTDKEMSRSRNHHEGQITIFIFDRTGPERRWLHANLPRPYHARVNYDVVNNCFIVYEYDEDLGTLPVFNTA